MTTTVEISERRTSNSPYEVKSRLTLENLTNKHIGTSLLDRFNFDFQIRTIDDDSSGGDTTMIVMRSIRILKELPLYQEITLQEELPIEGQTRANDMIILHSGESLSIWSHSDPTRAFHKATITHK